MKKSIQFVKRKDNKIICKKKGIFGWKYLVEVYDGNWAWHYTWSYFLKPNKSGEDVFNNKKEAVKILSDYYHSYRMLKEELTEN